MQIHVLTPFSRPANIPALMSILEPARVAWHLIAHAPEATPPLPAWVHVHDCGKELGQKQAHPWDICYWKLNWWIRTQQIDDAARYFVLCDDDGFPPDYFDRVRAAGDGPVVMTSSHLGYRQPPGSYNGIEILYAKPEYMRRGKVGFQFHVRGDVLRTLVFPNCEWGDGAIAEFLAAFYEVTYLPDLFRWFNWLEPGRW